jgi:hypothetical protein
MFFGHWALSGAVEHDVVSSVVKQRVKNKGFIKIVFLIEVAAR